MAVFPSAAEIDRSTPAGRDRVLDLVRIVSLLVVVTGHAVMAVVTVSGSGDDTTLRLDNLLGVLPGLQPITWVLQVLPLFFFAGAAASAIPWVREGGAGRTGGWGPWLVSRSLRLYRPLAAYVLFWAVVLLAASTVLPAGVRGPLAGVATQLAWFLGIYVMVLACVPLLARIRTPRALVATVAGLALAVALVDAGRLGGVLPSAAGFVNFVLAWLVPATLGVGYLRGLLARGPVAVAVILAFVADVLLVAVGPYEVSLVTVPGQVISNMTPPSLLVVGHSVVLCGLAVLLRPALARLAARPRAWRWIAIGNGGAMTIYLWHLPCLVVTLLVFPLVGLVAGPHDSAYAWQLALRIVCVYALVALVFPVLSTVENARLPWWDAPVGRPGRPRAIAAGIAVTLSGALVLAHAQWGLAWPGSAVIAAAAVLALAGRLLAGTRPEGS